MEPIVSLNKWLEPFFCPMCRQHVKCCLLAQLLPPHSQLVTKYSEQSILVFFKWLYFQAILRQKVLLHQLDRRLHLIVLHPHHFLVFFAVEQSFDRVGVLQWREVQNGLLVDGKILADEFRVCALDLRCFDTSFMLAFQLLEDKTTLF